MCIFSWFYSINVFSISYHKNLCSITTGEKQCVPVRDHTRSVFVHVGNTKPLAPWENKKYHCSNLFNYLLVHRFEESSHFLLRLCKNTAAVPRICVWIFSFFFVFFLVQQTHFVSAHSSFVMEEAVRRRYIICVCILITDQQNDLMRQSSKPPRASLSSSCKYVGVVTWVYLYWFRFLEDDVIVQRAGLSNVSGQVFILWWSGCRFIWIWKSHLNSSASQQV